MYLNFPEICLRNFVKKNLGNFRMHVGRFENINFGYVKLKGLRVSIYYCRYPLLLIALKTQKTISHSLFLNYGPIYILMMRFFKTLRAWKKGNMHQTYRKSP